MLFGDFATSTFHFIFCSDTIIAIVCIRSFAAVTLLRLVIVKNAVNGT